MKREQTEKKAEHTVGKEEQFGFKRPTVEARAVVQTK